MEVAGAIAIAPLVAPVDGAGSVVAAAGDLTAIDWLRRAVGRENPMKPGAGGLPQPYSAASGRYLSPSANTGVSNSPLAQVTGGFGHGFASAVSGMDLPPAVSNLHSWAQVIGSFVGNLPII